MKNNSRKIMQVEVRAGTGREHFVNYQERHSEGSPRRKEKKSIVGAQASAD
jgi:hypothetical protein